jgi:hypothetical protein
MRFRCYSCPGDHLSRRPEFEGDPGAARCPKCGAGDPAIIPLVDVHFIVLDAKGPIAGLHGLRQYVACQPQRHYLAAHVHDDFAATDVPAAVTCPSCQGTPAWKTAAALDKQFLRQIQIEQSAGGCC